MSFVSVMGWFVILSTLVTSSVGFYEAQDLGNWFVGVLAFFGLLYGLYLGSLGIKVDDIEEGSGLVYVTDKEFGREVTKLTERIEKLENPQSETEE